MTTKQTLYTDLTLKLNFLRQGLLFNNKEKTKPDDVQGWPKETYGSRYTTNHSHAQTLQK